MKLPLTDVLEHLEALALSAPESNGVFDNPNEASSFVIRLKRLREELQKADSAEISLAAIGSAVFPDTKTSSRRTMFSTFRSQIKELAADSGRRLALIQPSVRNRDAAEILCFFEGDAVPRSLEGPTKQSTMKLDAGPELERTRITPDVIRIFVSFANKDRAEADDLVDLLRRTWGENRSHRVDLWKFDEPAKGGILAGENNEDAIRKEMASCPFGLLLLSPDYMASKFINEVELAEYFPRKANKHPIPVNLRNSSPGAKHLLPEMQKSFIFTKDKLSFDEMKSRADKERFAMALNEQIEQLCLKQFPKDGPHPVIAPPIPTLERDFADHEGCMVRGKYRREASLGDNSPEESANGMESLPDLLAWAESDKRSCYFALLGEVGAGKTTTTLLFARALNTKPGKVRAYHFDMRYANYDGLLKRTHNRPLLDDILSAILRRSQLAEKVSAQDYVKAVRQERAVLIFDGLDEILVTLNTSEQDAFMQQLLSALPIESTRSKDAGKLLLACRTHFFRSSIAERGAFTLQGREGLDENPSRGSAKETTNRASFEVARILPFTEEQIREYFAANLPLLPFDRIWHVLESIHNLRELATRPYLLNLIRQQLPRLSQTVEAGQTVRTVDLYAGFMEDWSQERNKFHNVMLPQDKLRLMALLAAWMWKKESKTVGAEELEKWLLGTIVTNPVWMAQYGHLLRPDHVNEILSDLRTASFVARWEGDVFRFAHTSIQEYFLAQHLAQALADGDDTAWDMPMTSVETLDFLGELLTSSASPKSMPTLERLLGGPCLQAACLAFRYWLEAIRHGHLEPQPKHVNLAGAEANEWQIKGRSAQHPLNLRGANLQGIQLNHSRVEFVDLAEADLTGMQARQALFIHVSAPKARVINADLAGTQWRRGSLIGANLTGTSVSRIELSDVGTTGALGIAQTFSPPFPPHWQAAKAITGHSRIVSACAWSPDGNGLLSGSYDNSLKVWDAHTGQERFSLIGHSGSVSACAWSPDGNGLLSGSDDNSLKVWDAHTGQERFSLNGHSSAVSACAWSPDGNNLLSGSFDNSLKVWDAHTGQERFSLNGHSSAVWACAWSPDGKKLLSGSADNSLKVWDAYTGQERFSLNGHSSTVSACAWSPDGNSLLSGSCDNSLKVWDAHTGQERFVLNGHADWVRACAWSPDGNGLLSGSDDNSLKVWDAHTGQERFSFNGHSSAVWACAWSPDGGSILSGSSDNSLKVWDAHTGQERLFFQGNSNWVCACAWSPDGTRLFSGSLDKSLKVWDAHTGQERFSLKGHSDWVRACAWSPDGTSLISGSDDNSLKVWDAHTGQERFSLIGHSGSVSACAWSPDGKSLLSGSYDKSLKVWEAHTGKKRFSLVGHSSAVSACAWSPDSNSLLSGSHDKFLKVWDAHTGQERFTLIGHLGSVFACAWSPDGNSILSGSRDNSLKVWDAHTGQERFSLIGHSRAVSGCAWSPDGNSFLSGSHDNSLKVWDAASRECLRTVQLLPENQSASISGDAQRILHASPEAWRWLGWQTFDAEGRFLKRLPAEAFGPIPGLD